MIIDEILNNEIRNNVDISQDDLNKISHLIILCNDEQIPKITCYKFILKLLMKYLLSNKYKEATYILEHTKLMEKLHIPSILKEISHDQLKRIRDDKSFFEILNYIDDINKIDNSTSLDDIAASFLLLIIKRLVNSYCKFKELKIKLKDESKYSPDMIKKQHKVDNVIHNF